MHRDELIVLDVSRNGTPDETGLMDTSESPSRSLKAVEYHLRKGASLAQEVENKAWLLLSDKVLAFPK